MKSSILPLAFSLSLAASALAAPEGNTRQSPPAEGGARLHLLPRGADETLGLTPEQRKRIGEIEEESRAKVEEILTAEQKQKLAAMRPPAGGPGEKRQPSAPPAGPAGVAVPAVPATPAPQQSSVSATRPLPPGVTRIPVSFSGGHETEPVDHGRPVVLIAAALGVKDEVFREAFSHVHPAGPGRGGPTDSEARANKEALMSRLAQYGITDERLNAVSNYYRYAAWQGGIWKNQAASANALVKDGAVIGYEILNGGHGYTKAPVLSVPGFPGSTASVQLSFGKNFETNGAIAAISPAPSR